MSTHRRIDVICVTAVVLSLLLTIAFMNGEALGIQSADSELGYESRLFDTSVVHTIDIVMDDWDEFIETCENEEYAVCAVVIDGEAYKNVGIRAKGNTSLSTVSQMGSSRYSFKIEFDQYDSTKSYYGLDKLSLNNLIQDNTMMKDYLTYQMMDAFGVDSPLCSYVYITVNGEDWGLYLAVEGVEDAFLQRNYGSDHGELYKPDSLNMGAGRGNGRDFDMGDFTPQNESTETENVIREPDVQEFDMGGESQTQSEEVDFGGGFTDMPDIGENGMASSDVKLQYIDDDPESYSNIFDNAKTDVSDADKERLIESLKDLSNYENLESVVNVDEVIRYFVVHNFVVNDDSYTGSMVHNYYLYEEDGCLSMIPWDYNLAFGTFQGGDADSAVNDPIDDVLSDRPMQAWIFSDEVYTEMYHELYAEFLSTVDVEAIIDQAYQLISSYVEKDPTKFCTYEEFETGVETLRTFCRLRSESVQGQLDGIIPSTSEGQQESGTELIDAGDLNLSDMGTMNNGMGNGGRGGELEVGGFRTVDTGTQQNSGELNEAFIPEMPDDSGMDMGRQGGGFGMESGTFQFAGEDGSAVTDTGMLVLLGVSLIVLLAGLLIAFKYRI